ncbi:hypothetical protein ACGFYV_05985 [Streptomyces sp. NPDC048297]|uniref:hypothetical protein n=1 Tax=Streptomyces sp. NPDC048297 TaxID=3365531 RepID=UPI003712C338
MMTKLIRRTALAGASTVLAGAALLATGGSALAATDHLGTHTPAKVVATGNVRTPAAHHTHTHKSARPDAWIAGQLEMVSPWISDQLARFVPTGHSA